MTLTPFDDRDVTETRIRITRAGDGLSEGLDVDPVELHLDDVVHVLLRCVVSKVGHEPCKETNDLRRVHVLRTVGGTLVDDTAANGILDGQRHRIEVAAGVQHLFSAHDNGHGA